MLGRRDYTREEFDRAKTTIDQQVAAYEKLVKAVGGGTAEKKVGAALADFEPRFFNNLVLALDRFFVHRIRKVTGKDGTPLNEVELICDALMNNGGVQAASTVLELDPEQSVLGLHVGDAIQLSQEQVERLSAAFFAELEDKFL